MRWFLQHLPADGSVSVVPHGGALAGLAIAGPRSRDVLQAVTHTDVSGTAFRFMDIKRIPVGMASALVGRVSYTGDLGYELWCDPASVIHIFDALMTAGDAHGIRLFGSRALNSLRLEKAYGSWAREYRPIYTPLEAGLERFVALGKDADFIGKQAAAADKASGGRLRLRCFVVDAANADVIGDEPIWHSGKVCGWVTSGGYAHGSRLSVAMGYVPRELADHAEGWEIEILGERRSARLQAKPLFDADAKRLMG
jgi:dimethylglycine dehydrogenase